MNSFTLSSSLTFIEVKSLDDRRRRRRRRRRWW
jgi:hypothetical protein